MLLLYRFEKTDDLKQLKETFVWVSIALVGDAPNGRRNFMQPKYAADLNNLDRKKNRVSIKHK